jgi:hypothetical protein
VTWKEVRERLLTDPEVRAYYEELMREETAIAAGIREYVGARV